MKLIHYKKVKPEKVEYADAKDVTIRWLISKEDGAPTFAMRIFELKPKGFTPYHSHNWEHEVFILNGKGEITCEGKGYPFKKGNVIFVPAGEKHQFKNSSKTILELLCIVPHKPEGKK